MSYQSALQSNNTELEEILQEINELPEAGSGLDTSDATAVAGNIDFGETAYANGVKLVGSKRRKEYTGEIVSTLVGSGVYAVLAQDDFLAEYRNEESLFVRVEFDVGQIPYTIVKTWAANNLYTIISDSENNKQYVHRWDSSGKRSVGYPTNLVTDDTPIGVGSVLITEAGELRCHCNSGNFAIRPSKYKAVIEW